MYFGKEWLKNWINSTLCHRRLFCEDERLDRSTASLKMTLKMLGQSIESNQICLVACQSMKFIHLFSESIPLE